MEGFKLNELSYDDEFLNALGELELRIIEDYNQFLDNDIMKKEFAESIAYIPGSKYLKVIKKIGHQTMVWGFISLKDFKKGYAGIKFKEGDILKAQGWRAPALNKPRGNIFDNNYVINWTGPKYMSGYSAGGKRNGGLL
jgi:hypothetical protein